MAKKRMLMNTTMGKKMQSPTRAMASFRTAEGLSLPSSSRMLRLLLLDLRSTTASSSLLEDSSSPLGRTRMEGSLLSPKQTDRVAMEGREMVLLGSRRDISSSTLAWLLSLLEGMEGLLVGSLLLLEVDEEKMKEENHSARFVRMVMSIGIEV